MKTARTSLLIALTNSIVSLLSIAPTYSEAGDKKPSLSRTELNILLRTAKTPPERWRITEYLPAWRHEDIVAAILKDKPEGTKLLPNEISPNAAFSLLTTVEDYSLFLPMLRCHNKRMFLPQFVRKSAYRSHALTARSDGPSVSELSRKGSDPAICGKWGDNGGWKNFFLLHRESHTAIVTFTNGGNGMHVIERVMRTATGDEQVAFLWV